MTSMEQTNNTHLDMMTTQIDFTARRPILRRLLLNNSTLELVRTHLLEKCTTISLLKPPPRQQQQTTPKPPTPASSKTPASQQSSNGPKTPAPTTPQQPSSTPSTSHHQQKHTPFLPHYPSKNSDAQISNNPHHLTSPREHQPPSRHLTMETQRILLRSTNSIPHTRT
ncbi:hypothetical protein M3J09_013312 [Ascochyta lentis]